MDIELSDVTETGPFEFRWPNATERFETGWTASAIINGKRHRVRHGLGVRTVYGRERVHTVTWLDGSVQVEGVEADDYPVSQALISQLLRPGRATARTRDQIPPGYNEFVIVDHHHEIEARYSRRCFAVKIEESDLEAWATHAWLRSQLPRKVPAALPEPSVARAPAPLPPPPSPDAQAVVQALLAHGDAMINEMKSSGIVQFTPDREANQLVHDDGFAFLIAVISDMGIRAERAWELPFRLRERLGGLTPEQVAANPSAVRDAFQQQPKLHRFVNNVPSWISEAARIVISDYHGDAAALWADAPTALELCRRLERFPGISQKKAAMTVVLLNQCLNYPLRELSGGDVAVDVHLRRVFPRTGLTQDDKVDHIVAAARRLNPEYPGALDMPAWDIGRRWCHRTSPECGTCPLGMPALHQPGTGQGHLMEMRASARPRMNGDPSFRSAKLDRLWEPHVRPLNALVEKWTAEGRQVPWVDSDSGGVHSRILFLLESPGPASSIGHGSGVISPDNDDQTAERFWRISQQAGLARDEYVNWNAVPWYVSGTQKNANATQADARAAEPYLHEFIMLLGQLRVVVTMGGFAESAWLRYLRRPDSPVIALITSPHPSVSARRGRPGFEEEIGTACDQGTAIHRGPRHSLCDRAKLNNDYA